MAEFTNNNPAGRENYSSVKEWLFSKLQISHGDDEGKAEIPGVVEGDSDPAQTGRVPKIVISRGSMKSINSPLGTPVLRPLSPLVKSYSDTTSNKKQNNKLMETNSVDGTKYTWRSPAPDRKVGRSKPHSEPSTPVDGKGGTRSPAPHTGGIQLLSPVFRFSIRDTLSSCNSTPTSIRSAPPFSTVDKDPSRCNSTKSVQTRKNKSDRDNMHESAKRTLSEAKTSLGQSDPCANRSLTIRRTSSCGPHLDRHYAKQNDELKKAMSHTDVNNTSIRKTHSGKIKRGRRAGSKEKARSAISLTRSISINLDFFRGRRSSRSRSSDRKLSLANNDELQRVYERRRSSLMRLLCQGQSNDSSNAINDTSSESSAKNIAEYSPKVTRPLFIGSLRKLGTTFDDFRSTFESETRENPSVYGQIKIMFQYMSDKKQLEVTLLRGCNMAARTEGTLGIYTKVCLVPGKKQRQRSESRHNTHDPAFHDLFCFRYSLDTILESQLKFKFYDKPGIFSVSVPIGECEVKLYNYDLTAVTVIWLNLKEPRSQKMRNSGGMLDFDDDTDIVPRRRGLRKLFTACTRK